MPGETSPLSLQWPRITLTTKPWSRWWWMGGGVNEKDLTPEMERYAEAGLGGLEITPIYGVKGREDLFIPYLSPQWMKLLDHVLKEAERLDMGVDMATGNGWPFGGPWIKSEDACKNVVHRTYTLEEGEILTTPIQHTQTPMVRAIGHHVDIHEIKDPISDNDDLQVLALEQARFERPLPLQALVAHSDRGETIDLTRRVDALDGILDWTAPAGRWTLHAVFQGWHGKLVERAGPGGEGNVIDHFSASSLKKHLDRFDQAFSGHDVRALRAFFNDSYEVDDALGESDWTVDLFDKFASRRGYDLRQHLPALFGDHSDDQGLRVLCDYRETISDLLLEEFTIPWNEWARSKSATTRNQAHGSPANILDLYAASGIPETEGADVLRFMLASSAAHVTGKPLVSSESATWLDEHFLSSLADVKRALDLNFLGGINHVCYHGTTFSPPSERWPGLLFYASVHFGPTNAFWHDFSALNDYVARCQSFLQLGRPDNDALLYFPIHDLWSAPGKGLLMHFAGVTDGTTVQRAANELLTAGYTFDFISDRQLMNVQVAGASLHAGGSSYGAIILPECRYMPLATLEKLAKLADQNATIVVQKSLPIDVPGWGDLDSRRDRFQGLVTRIESGADGDGHARSAKVGQGGFRRGAELIRLLANAGIHREPMVDRNVRFVRRDVGNGRIYFVVNSGAEAVNGWIPLRAPMKSAAIYDAMSGNAGLAALRVSTTGQNEFYMQLAPGESRILRTFDSVIQGPKQLYFEPTGETQEIDDAWTVRFIEGGPELPPTIEAHTLDSWTNWGGDAVNAFSGTARYVVSFPGPRTRADQWLLDLGKVRESAHVYLNGKELGTLIAPPYALPILAKQLREKNILEIEVSNLMANRIADMDRRKVRWKKFYNVNFPARNKENRGADGMFDAARWLPRESGLIGPVRLIPLEEKDL